MPYFITKGSGKDRFAKLVRHNVMLIEQLTVLLEYIKNNYIDQFGGRCSELVDPVL